MKKFFFAIKEKNNNVVSNNLGYSSIDNHNYQIIMLQITFW